MPILERNEREYLRIRDKFAYLWDDDDFKEILKEVRRDLRQEMGDAKDDKELISLHQELKALDRVTGKIYSLYNEKVAEVQDERDS
jgi:hypothetical protein